MLLNAIIVNCLTHLKMAYLLSLSLSKSSKSTLLVGSLTVFSRLLGFWRDVLIAQYFGATLATDAFFAPFRFPNLLRRLFAEGAFSQVFVPTLTHYKAQKTTRELEQMIHKIASHLTLLMLIITFCGVMIAPVLILVSAGGFHWQSEQHQLATQLLQIMLPYGFFITLTAFMGSILNTHSQYAVPALTPALLNMAMIGATLWLTPYFQQPIIALAVGVFIGGVMQLALQMFALHQLHLLPKLQRNVENSATQHIMNRMLPTLFTNSATQINFLANTLIASFLATGSVSWLYYADRLLELPSGILSAYAIGLIGFLVVKVLTPAFTTCHIHSVAVRYTWICLGINLALALILAQPFAHVGIALASTLATSLNAALLLFFLWRKQLYTPLKTWRVFSLQILFSSVMLIETLRYFSNFASWSAFYLIKCVMVGVASYFAGLFLSGYFYTDNKK